MQPKSNFSNDMKNWIYKKSKKVLPFGFRVYLLRKRNSLVHHLIIFAHHVNMKKVIIWIWRAHLKKINIEVCDSKGSVLVFNSPGGREDLEGAYFGSQSQYIFLTVYEELIKSSCKYYLGANIEDYNGKLDTAPGEAREKYRAFLVNLIAAL